MPPLLPLDAALALLDGMAPPELGVETIPVGKALGRTLGEPLAAVRDLPAFDNSAVDGYTFAVVGTGVIAANTMLKIIGESAAGTPFSGSVNPGEAVRIATGAMLPQGTGAVVMQEVCEATGDTVIIRESPSAGANCRRAGDDLKAGTQVLAAGRAMGAAELSMAVAMGRATVSVRRRLRVAIASTGSELREPGPQEHLAPGLLYDSNRPLLKALLARYPVDIVDLGILADEEAPTRHTLLAAAASVDFIITTGGISVGARDYVRETMETDGEILFSRLAIRPGRPLLCGLIGSVPLIGLPGNPVSTFVTFQLVCRKLLHHLIGTPYTPPLRFPVAAGFTYRKNPLLREFVRVVVTCEADRLVAHSFRNQLSNLISSLMESDGLLDLPAGAETIEAGQVFDYLPWAGFVAPGGL